jgi:hypothetical protein
MGEVDPIVLGHRYLKLVGADLVDASQEKLTEAKLTTGKQPLDPQARAAAAAATVTGSTTCSKAASMASSTRKPPKAMQRGSPFSTEPRWGAASVRERRTISGAVASGITRSRT